MMDPIIYGSSESATKINQHAPLVGQSTLEYDLWAFERYGNTCLHTVS